MSSLNALLDVIECEQIEARESVLATVVKVEGSAYRRPGARMLVSQYGRPEGTISGGCLEGDVVRKAWWLSETGPVIRSYSTAEATDEEGGEDALGFGLGCNGKVYVLFERIPAQKQCALLDALRNVRNKQIPVAIATVIACSRNSRADVGNRVFLEPGAAPLGGLHHPGLNERIAADLRLTLDRQKSSLQHYAEGPTEIEVFLEYIAPAPRVIIFGAGHDAQPLVRMAKILGWHVTVIDSRSHFARPERFPEADSVLNAHIGESFEFLELVEGAFVAVMSHSISQDAHWLKGSLQGNPRYIGQLGPRARTERLLDEIIRQTDQLPARDRLHYPMGLDIGGDTPESVAMAVLGEMQAVMHGRAGASLKLRASTIHENDRLESSCSRSTFASEQQRSGVDGPAGVGFA